MFIIRDAQVASDFRCLPLVVSAFVIYDTVRNFYKVSDGALDRHAAVLSLTVLLCLLRAHVQCLRFTHHASRLQWQRGADLLVLDADMRRLFDQSVVSLTAFRQAVMDNTLLILHVAFSLLRQYGWQLMAMSTSEVIGKWLPRNHELITLNHAL